MPIVLLKISELNKDNDQFQENKNEKKFTVGIGEFIYDALENQGTQLPHGCLSGSCGTCRIDVIKGHEHLQPPTAIERDTLHHLQQQYREKYGEEWAMTKVIRLSCRTKIKEEGVVSIIPLVDNV